MEHVLLNRQLGIEQIVVLVFKYSQLVTNKIFDIRMHHGVKLRWL